MYSHIYSLNKTQEKFNCKINHTHLISRSTCADRKRYENVYIGHECSAAYNPIGYEATRLTQIKQEVKKPQLETAATLGWVETAYYIILDWFKCGCLIQYNWHLATRLNKTNVLHEGEST